MTPTDQAEATPTGTLYTDRFGAEPDGVWSAPGRVNLIGEHTDYNGGLVLPFAIPSRTRAAIGRLGPERPGLHLTSAQLDAGDTITVTGDELEPGKVDGWAAYVAGVVWALDLGDAIADNGLAIAVDSEVPVGSGLSSSAALLCSVALGLDELFELGHDRDALAAVTQRVENDFVGAPTGGMDQRASLLCRDGHVLRFDVLADETQLVPFAPESVELGILVVDTRVEHANVDGGYGARRADCEAAAEALEVDVLAQVDEAALTVGRPLIDDDRVFRRARHVVTEIARVDQVCEALTVDDWDTVGRLLTEAHASIRDDFEASCAELDCAVDTMVEAGALGARMTGGGFGGSAIGLVPLDQMDAVEKAVTDAFERAGFGPPSWFTVSPSAGAHRDR